MPCARKSHFDSADSGFTRKYSQKSALVAQGIEQLPSKQWVTGSIPVEGATNIPCCIPNMAGVAQQVRAPGCGPGGRGFEPLFSPHFTKDRSPKRLWSFLRLNLVKNQEMPQVHLYLSISSGYQFQDLFGGNLREI